MVPHKIIKSNRKTLSISINDNAELIVRAPKRVSNDQIKEFITEKGFDPKFGARPLKRLLQKYIEDTIAELVVLKKVSEGSKITLSFDPKKEEGGEPPVKVKITNPKTEE